MRIRLPPLFDEARAAQAAAHLLRRAGGSLTVLKLVKLLYLAERRSLADFAVPLVGDVAVAMQHGPVMSRTLDLINGSAAGATGAWDDLMAEREGHTVALRDAAAPPRLGALSRADLRTLDATFDEFGGMAPWALVDWCHANLPEWDHPGFGAIQIPLRAIFVALGHTDAEADAAVAALDVQAREAEAMRPVEVDADPF